MDSEASAREYLAAHQHEQRAHRGSALSWMGLGPSAAVKDRLAYRLGRSGTKISERVLKAKVAVIHEDVTRIILGLRSKFARLKSQEEDVLAHVAYIVAIFFGLTVLVAALLVDYRIIHEFWTRAVMDELGKIPASLKSSVYFKSGQVVFATLAFHFMLETVGEAGRKAFVLFIFALTFTMLLGIGFIVANNWLPPGSALFGVDLHAAGRAGHDILAQLGLPSQSAPSGAGTQLADNMNTARTLIWLGSLSMIFIIVTGVGALSLRNAVHNFSKLSGAETNDFAAPGAAGLKGSRKEQLEQLKVQAGHFGIQLEPERVRSNDGIDGGPQGYNENVGRQAMARSSMIRAGLDNFAESYTTGLNDYQTSFFGLFGAARKSRAEELSENFDGVFEGVYNGYVEDYVAKHAVPYLDKPVSTPSRSKGRPSLRAVPMDDDERFGTGN